MLATNKWDYFYNWTQDGSAFKCVCVCVYMWSMCVWTVIKTIMIGLELLLGDFYRFIAGRIFVVCRQQRCGCRCPSPAARWPLLLRLLLWCKQRRRQVCHKGCLSHSSSSSGSSSPRRTSFLLGMRIINTDAGRGSTHIHTHTHRHAHGNQPVYVHTCVYAFVCVCVFVSLFVVDRIAALCAALSIFLVDKRPLMALHRRVDRSMWVQQ